MGALLTLAANGLMAEGMGPWTAGAIAGFTTGVVWWTSDVIAGRTERER